MRKSGWLKSGKNNGKRRQVFVVTGSVGEGKTTFIRNLVTYLQEKGMPVAGILSERILDGAGTTGYDVAGIETGRREVFLREEGDCGTEKIGRFSICPEGLHFGKSDFTITGRSKLRGDGHR